MLDNLVVVAIVIIVLWLGAMAFYFYVSRQQGDLADEIEKLREQLDEIEGEKGTAHLDGEA
jgi:preprotein translocase subunit YajC